MMVHDGSSTRCCLLVDGYWPWAPWRSSLVHRLETPPRVEKIRLWHHEKKTIATVYHGVFTLRNFGFLMELDSGPFSQEVLQRRQPLVSHSADADPTGGLVDCYLEGVVGRS